MHQQRMQCLTYVQCFIRNPVRIDLRFTFVGANDGATSCDRNDSAYFASGNLPPSAYFRSVRRPGMPAAIGKTERRNPAGSVGIPQPLPPQYTTTQPDGDKSFLIYDNASTDAQVLVIDNALAEAEVYRYELGEPGPFFTRRRCNAYVRR
ncbi:hypothetical protein DPMN_171259 [Dreissena polymorpha]|uniref:Uncharacterized protein n=1 Tax=Dreissena polymorpha TaxID=45954 RepID=A0A9D4E0T7_DREPO|nr:hypothetical protein DPMN_171259 [Dreissena polymorpha]